jgi:predicted nuclease of predicted toxin-antitoxin system
MFHLLLDQNLSPLTTIFLRSLGYDVTDTRELGLSIAEDSVILECAKELNRTILTFNGDFADITEIPLGTHPGIIRLKVIPQTEEILHPILKQHLNTLSQQEISGCLIVIDNWKMRIKRK